MTAAKQYSLGTIGNAIAGVAERLHKCAPGIKSGHAG